MNRKVGTILVIAVLAASIYFLMRGGYMGQAPKKIGYSRVLEYVDSRTILSAVFDRDTVTLNGLDNTQYTAILPDTPQARAKLLDRMEAKSVKFTFIKSPANEIIQGLLPLLSVILIMGVFWFFMMRQAQSGNNQAMSFGRSRARRAGENTPKVTFANVAGVDEAKEELSEIVDFLKNPKKYSALGAKIPRGVLLLGPPGCGKTLLARAVAGEAEVPFFHSSGSEFVEMFVGVGASRVRDLFETAKANRPCLIFIDEIDAVGRQRGAGLGGGHDEREQTLNQMLVEMDGFDPNSGIILLAATNRPDVLDPALLRPGRFDRQVMVDPPDQKGREEILRVHMKDMPFDDNVDRIAVSKMTPGFSGADLANLVNEAALMAAREDCKVIENRHIEEAVDRVIAGPEKKSRLIDPSDKEMVAYHEVGHAIVGELLPNSDPVHKVTILPRGMALGVTMYLPEKDSFLVTRAHLLDAITSFLGGRAAETMRFGTATTGANNDLSRATEIARAMVCEYGMSDKLGHLTFGRRHGNPFLGRDIMEDRNYSEEIATIIDNEIRTIVDECFRRGLGILQANHDMVVRVAEALMDQETLDRKAFLELLGDTAKVEPKTSWGEA